MIQDYSILEIEGKSIFFIGGAISIDRKKRIAGVDWWPDEKVPYSPNDDYAKQHIDYVISHKLPLFAESAIGILPTYGKQTKVIHQTILGPVEEIEPPDYELYFDLIREGELLNDVYKKIATHNKIEKWFCGHYHRQQTIYLDGTMFVVLAINEIKEIW